MAETPEQTTATGTTPETKKMVNPRVEIDTSPPFGSVEEAVNHFGGRGSWIPYHLLRLAAHHGIEDYDYDKVEEQASQLEKDLLVKERETLGVLQELEATKRFVEGLKLKLVKEVSECMGSPDLTLSRNLIPCPPPSPGLILMELNQAKLNLNRSTSDLAVIRSSVESLNNKMKKDKVSEQKPHHRQIQNPSSLLLANKPESRSDSENLENVPKQLQKLNFEAEQFKNIAEAAKYEMMKAMSEIEQTKMSLNMVEMRLIAARKMEEAARAVEAVAFAEIKSQKPNGITLSFEEYSSLAQKAQIVDEISKKRARIKKPEETTKEMIHGQNSKEVGKSEAEERTGRSEMRQYGHNSMFKFKNSYPSYGNRDSQLLDGNDSSPVEEEKTVPVLRSTISIGDILSRKLILQDDFVMGNHVQTRTERQQVSLSQMLREQSGLILQPKKSVKEGIVHKQFFSQRKKFGFIDITLPLTKQSKKKTQASNLR